MEAMDRLLKLVEKHRLVYERDDVKTRAVKNAASEERRFFRRGRLTSKKLSMIIRRPLTMSL